MTELKNCPFCGHQEPILMRMANAYVIGCPDCEAEVRTSTESINTTCCLAKAKHKCIERWNKREGEEQLKFDTIMSIEKQVLESVSVAYRPHLHGVFAAIREQENKDFTVKCECGEDITARILQASSGSFDCECGAEITFGPHKKENSHL